MRFQLQDDSTQLLNTIELNTQLRMPLESYASAESCLVLDDVAMSNLNWKIVLDEAFRSIKANGSVEFNFTEFQRYDLRRMWTYLGRPTFNRKCELLEYGRVQGNKHRVKVSVKRVPKSSNTWSICYITDGRNVSQINATAEIIDQYKDIEILVSGPKDRMLNLHKKVCVLDDQGLPRDAMISLKKNMLIEQAKNENILLLHDRYLISEDFFSHFEEFGYDFDILVPKQIYFGTDIEFPGFLAEEDNQLLAVDQHIIRDDFTVNGGCIVIKRDLALATPLNAFLAWQEAEDFDWSLRLIQNGDLPRPIRNAVIFTVGTELSKTAKIKPLKFEVPKPDFFTELDCIIVAHPLIFFEHLPHLINSYSTRTKWAGKLAFDSKHFGESWNTKTRMHMTPLRYCFALTLALTLKVGRNPLQVSRRHSLLEFLRYTKELSEQDKKIFPLIAPLSTWLFTKKS